jgi:hypothetical protein
MKFSAIVVLSIIALAVAVPVEDEGKKTESVGQHAARVGLLATAGACVLGLTLGTIAFGIHLFQRYQVIQAEHRGNKVIWEAEQAQKDTEHQKNMAALDILLDVARNYTVTIGKAPEEFNPLAIADRLQDDVEDAEIIGVWKDNNADVL